MSGICLKTLSHRSLFSLLSAAGMPHLQLLLEAQLELILLTQLLLQRSPFTRVTVNQTWMWAKQKDSYQEHRNTHSHSGVCVFLTLSQSVNRGIKTELISALSWASVTRKHTRQPTRWVSVQRWDTTSKVTDNTTANAINRYTQGHTNMHTNAVADTSEHVWPILLDMKYKTELWTQWNAPSLLYCSITGQQAWSTRRVLSS